MSGAATARGACLCGAVTYEATGPLRPVVACHCSQCRKSSGHFLAATSVLREHVRIDGEEAVRWYRSSDGARRGFCSVCGSSLFWERDGAPRLSLFAGALEDGAGLRLAGHIFCTDKGDYYDIADDLPQSPADDSALTAP
ncbi:MAG: GFA family protein [Acidobacteriota bacterium]